MARKRKCKMSNDWVAVRYVNDNILYISPCKNIKQKIIIGNSYYIKWEDGLKYLAEVLKRGSKNDMETYIRSFTYSNDDDNVYENQLSQSLVQKHTIATPLVSPILDQNGLTLLNSEVTKDTVTRPEIQFSNSSSQDYDISHNQFLLNSQPMNIIEAAVTGPIINDTLNLNNTQNVFDDESKNCEEKNTISIPLVPIATEENKNEISLTDYEKAPDFHNGTNDIKYLRHSTRYPGLRYKSNVLDDDVIINKVPDINFKDSDESSFSEYYDSPEYNPYPDEKNNSDFEISDFDDIITLPTSPNFLKKPEIEKNTSETVSIQNDLNVQRVRKNENKLIKDKRVYCIFCEKLETNFPRHLERKHALESEVRSFILLPKNSKERLHQLELLKNKGNFHYNKNVLEKNQGSLIVGRRPTSEDKIGANDYLPCKYCLKFFKKNKMFRHFGKCKFKEQLGVETAVPKRRNIKAQCAMLLQNTKDFEHLVNEVFTNMKDDDVTFVAQNDKLICAFGTRLLQNHRERHLKTYISQRMRQLSKFLIILRTLIPGINNLQEFLVPKYYKTIVVAAKELSGYNENENTYVHPSIALKIGHSILQCADIIESKLIIESSKGDAIQQIKNFATVFQKEWKFSISSNACQDISKKKFNKVIDLPDAKDITLLHDFLKNQLQKVMFMVEEKEITEHTYRLLCQTLLSQIILLNRRRSGEVERIKIQDYLNRNKNKIQEEISKSLTDIETKLSNSFVRFEIRGKKGRGVPVLLTPQMKKAMDIILSIRKSVNVYETNEHIFAIPNTVVGLYRGSDCLKKSANECGASNPLLLTSTKLRKHIATMAQLLNLTTNDREQLANFMGHDLAIHNEYYRLPDNTLQLSRVSKILLAVESGKLHELKGKTLEEFDNIVPIEDCSSDIEDTNDAGGDSEGILTDDDDDMGKIKNSNKRGDYIKWTSSEIAAVQRSLGRFIALRKIPQKYDCLVAMQNEPILKNRNWKKIKFQVANLIKKTLK